MGKVLIVYETKYGNTRLAAEAISEGMQGVSENQVLMYELEEIDLKQPVDFDVLLIGSPNHMGGQTRGIRKFIDKLGALNLEGKYAAVFDTYINKDYEKAVNKMEKQINRKVPQLNLLTPGLSIRVEGMKGPITEDELPKCKDFGVRIASQVDK